MNGRTGVRARRAGWPSAPGRPRAVRRARSRLSGSALGTERVHPSAAAVVRPPCGSLADARSTMTAPAADRGLSPMRVASRLRPAGGAGCPDGSHASPAPAVANEDVSEHGSQQNGATRGCSTSGDTVGFAAVLVPSPSPTGCCWYQSRFPSTTRLPSCGRYPVASGPTRAGVHGCGRLGRRDLRGMAKLRHRHLPRHEPDQGATPFPGPCCRLWSVPRHCGWSNGGGGGERHRG